MIRVGIVDDHSMFREALASRLSKIDDLEVVLNAEDGDSFLEYSKVIDTDVVLMDLDMPDSDGLTVTKKARSQGLDSKIVVLTMIKNKKMILKMIDAGVNGYMVKDASIEELVHCIQEVNEKDFYYNEMVGKALHDRFADKDANDPSNPMSKLSKKEIRIIELVAQELTNKEIAEDMGLTVRSIESYRHRIMEKLDCKNVVGVIKFAVANGIVDV